MTAHARYAPSSSDRWMVCTASLPETGVLLTLGAIDRDDAGEAAAEGTIAHRIRELCLKLGLEAYAFIGQTMKADGFEFVVDEDMAAYVQSGIDFVEEQSANGRLYTEFRVDLSPWLPDQFGTCDTAWIDGRRLTIADLKYGRIDVDPVKARQPRLYALGAWHFLGRPEIDEVELIIDQPRRFGGIKSHVISFDELMAFGEEVRRVYRQIEAGDVKFRPGLKQCAYCPVDRQKGGCPAKETWLREMFGGALDQDDTEEPPTFVDPKVITPERRYWIVKNAKLATDWLNKLKEESLQAAIEGRPDPGSKLVIGRKGDRKISDPQRVDRILSLVLGEDRFKPRELITLTQMEAMFKPKKKKPGIPAVWNMIEATIRQAPGRPTLADEDDLRSDAATVSNDEFDDLD